jgi:putative aldouronate transport system substrate-binding protein
VADSLRAKDNGDSSLNRRDFTRRTAAIAGGTLLGSRYTGLNAGAQGTPVATPQGSAGTIVSPIEGVPNAYTQYPETYASVASPPGSGSTVRMMTLSYSPPPTPKEDNRYWQELETRLNVTYEADLVPIANYDERLATMFAGRDLPDLLFLLPSATRPMIYDGFNQGAFFDLTDFVESGQIQEYPNLAAIPAYLWDAVRVNGRIWGFPKAVLRNNDPTYLRRDWLDRFGMPALRSPDEVMQFLISSAKDDPDGNGSADTWGLAPYGGGWDSFILNQMFEVPYGWRLNDDGTLINQVETEEYRQALEFARSLYEAGAYHPDAATLTVQQSTDLMIAGRTGMGSNGFAAVFGPTGFRSRIKEQVPTGELEPIILPAPDGSEAVTYAGPGYFGFTAIAASAAQDESRLNELYGVLNYLFAPFGSEEETFLRYGLPGVHSEEAEGGGFTITDQGTSDRGALVYPFLSENFFFYPGMPEEAVIAQKFNERMASVAVRNPVQNVFSEAQGQNGAALAQFVADSYTAFVTGRESLDAFDDFVQEWRSRAGDQIRSEYEEALQATGS